MHEKYSNLLWIIGIEILIFWSGDIVVMGHGHHERRNNEDTLYTGMLARLGSNRNGVDEKEIIILYEEKRRSTHLPITPRIQREIYSRHRRNLRHNTDLPEVSLSLMSFHQVGTAHLRVLYVYGDVVAGKPIRNLESGRRMSKIGFRVTKYRNGNHIMKVVETSSNGLHRFVIADQQNEGLRICQAADVTACEVVENGRHVRTALFKIRHFSRKRQVLFPYQWGLAYQFGETEKYLKILDTTGQTTLSDCETDITKFNIFFNGG